jgi:Na+/H+ antiporter NhaD/arsenite permease-like protein
VLGAPLVVRLVKRHSLPALPFLLALATAANTGSAATLVGNPQNMLCGTLGGLAYVDHLRVGGPVALLGLTLNHGLLWLFFRRRLAAAALAPSDVARPVARRTWVTLAVIGGTAVSYVLGAHLAWASVAGFALLMLVHRHDTRQLWPRIDWALLLFFSGLFVVVEGFAQSGAPAYFFREFPIASGSASGGWHEHLRLSGIFLLGSNLVSNVPFILVVKHQITALPDPRLGWELLALASTFAGNLTLLGSVANVIVAEAGRDVGGMGFWEHFKVGLPLALGTTLLGAAWMIVAHG